MKIKYVEANSLEAAEQMAESFFGCSKNELIFEEIRKAEAGVSCKLLVFKGLQSELDNLDGCFGLFYEKDGVFLEFHTSRGGGIKLDHDKMAEHIRRKNLSTVDQTSLNEAMSMKSGRFKIAPPQSENIYNEELKVEISRDESEAYASLLPAEQGGRALDFDTAKEMLKRAGVIHGIIDQALESLLTEKKYGVSETVARQIEPENGQDGKLIFLFSTDEKTAKPMELEGGKVDYRSLDVYEPVKEGQILVQKGAPTEGTPGLTVTGREIPQKRGKEAVLPKGRNVILNEERTELSAKFSGMVEYINGSVNVSNVYEIKGDVDWGVGNIDFDGCVNVKGNVITGHVVKATGSIFVGGVVEAAEIISGGNVEVKRGMQGMDRGKIQAEGNINITYVERGVVEAGGNITVDMSVHSVLRAGDSIIAKGKRGSIVGGHASAGTDIHAVSLGSVSCVQTDIEVGFMNLKRERLKFLEKEMVRLSGDMQKLDQLDAHLKKTKGIMDKDTWLKLYLSGGENRKNNGELMDRYNSEMMLLQAEMEGATEGRVHVIDTAFPGVRVIIASNTYRVEDELSFATFKHRDGGIHWGPCEKGKSSS